MKENKKWYDDWMIQNLPDGKLVVSLPHTHTGKIELIFENADQKTRDLAELLMCALYDLSQRKKPTSLKKYFTLR